MDASATGSTSDPTSTSGATETPGYYNPNPIRPGQLLRMLALGAIGGVICLMPSMAIRPQPHCPSVANGFVQVVRPQPYYYCPPVPDGFARQKAGPADYWLHTAARSHEWEAAKPESEAGIRQALKLRRRRRRELASEESAPRRETVGFGSTAARQFGLEAAREFGSLRDLGAVAARETHTGMSDLAKALVVAVAIYSCAWVIVSSRKHYGS